MADEVQLISAWVPVTDEDIVDFGIGTEAQQAEAAARIEDRRRASDRRWRSLPWRVRLERTISGRRYELQRRALDRIHSALFPNHED